MGLIAGLLLWLKGSIPNPVDRHNSFAKMVWCGGWRIVDKKTTLPLLACGALHIAGGNSQRRMSMVASKKTTSPLCPRD